MHLVKMHLPLMQMPTTFEHTKNLPTTLDKNPYNNAEYIGWRARGGGLRLWNGWAWKSSVTMCDLPVSLCLVNHTPEKANQTGVHVYKAGRPASFLFAPSASDAYQYQILKKIPSA